jgi:hypothetical protein
MSEIPNHFERSLLTENKTTLSVSINHYGAAGVENVYITQIIAQSKKHKVSSINTTTIRLYSRKKHCFYPFLLVQQYLKL